MIIFLKTNCFTVPKIKLLVKFFDVIYKYGVDAQVINFIIVHSNDNKVIGNK